jgi:hypothetical protein
VSLRQRSLHYYSDDAPEPIGLTRVPPFLATVRDCIGCPGVGYNKVATHLLIQAIGASQDTLFYPSEPSAFDNFGLDVDLDNSVASDWFDHLELREWLDGFPHIWLGSIIDDGGLSARYAAYFNFVATDGSAELEDNIYTRGADNVGVGWSGGQSAAAYGHKGIAHVTTIRSDTPSFTHDFIVPTHDDIGEHDLLLMSVWGVGDVGPAPEDTVLYMGSSHGMLVEPAEDEEPAAKGHLLCIGHGAFTSEVVTITFSEEIEALASFAWLVTYEVTDEPQPNPPVTTPVIAIDPGMVADPELALELEPIDTISVDPPLKQWVGSGPRRT